MAKIHFTSLFGVDLDYDIMVHWCKHYTAMNYDSYTVFLHSLDRTTERYQFVAHAFEVAGFTVRQSPDAPYTSGMRNTILTNFAKSLDPLDYLCVADSDEFHQPGPWNTNFRDLVMSCDVLSGTLVDRWADSLIEANPSLPLDVQYPYTGDVFKIVYARTRDLERKRWYHPRYDKILAARAGLPVSHIGSHTLYTSKNAGRQRRGCIVEHYKWRKTIAERLKTKFYYYESHARAVADYFHVEGVPA